MLVILNMNPDSKGGCPYHRTEGSMTADFRTLLSLGGDVKRVEPDKNVTVLLEDNSANQMLINLRHYTANLIKEWFDDVEAKGTAYLSDLEVGVSPDYFHNCFSFYFRRSLSEWLQANSDSLDVSVAQSYLNLLSHDDISFRIGLDPYIGSGLFTASNLFSIVNIVHKLLLQKSYNLDFGRCEQILRHPNLPKLIQVLARLKIETIVAFDDLIDPSFEPEFGVLPIHNPFFFELKSDENGEFLALSSALIVRLKALHLDGRRGGVKSQVYTFCPALKGDVVGRMFRLYLENYIKLVLCR